MPQRPLLCCKAASPIFPGTTGGKQQKDLLLCGCSSTANANLEDAVIRLDTEDADQLSLDAPDLSGKTLAPGESCTITVVVEALDDGSDTLDASGRLSI